MWYGNAPFWPQDNGSVPLTAETPAVRAFAERNVASAPEFYGEGEFAIWQEALRLAGLWNRQWSHHLNADDVAALVAGNRLWDLTRTWSQENGWQALDPPVMPTPEQVNTWSLSGFGHDGINQMIAVRARCEREGAPHTCAVCEGSGQRWRDAEHKAAHDAWEPTDPPTGDGWQLWETVSEGSPISPVFATADELATWMSDPARDYDWVPAETAAAFIADGWAPTLIGSAETGVVSGVEFAGFHATTIEGDDER